jgi:hypothetical protein
VICFGCRQLCAEDEDTNRLVEALTLFAKIAENKNRFRNCAKILLLYVIPSFLLVSRLSLSTPLITFFIHTEPKPMFSLRRF